jgi:hypothetical protein
MVTVPMCVSGNPNMCMPGGSTAEVCDGVDNNCNGTVDDGGAALCGNPGHVMTTVCNGAGGCNIAPGGCATGYADYSGGYGDGCECDLTGGGLGCMTARSLGNIAVSGSMSVNANIGPGASSWFVASFPPVGGVGGRGGVPTITISPPANFRIQVFQNCGGATYSCNAVGDVANSGSAGMTAFAFGDQNDNFPSGTTTADQTWPSTAYIQVTRTSTAGTCGQAAFTLTITRS